MKQKLLFLLLVIAFLTVVGIAINTVRNRTPKQGELKIESQPIGTVYLEGKNIGRTPIGKTTMKVAAGDYTLKIEPDPGITQLVSWQERITIGPNVLTYVNATMTESELTSSSYVLFLQKMNGKKSELSITTSPDGATVIFDDETKGLTPLILPEVTPGDHTITLVSRGFVTRMMKVRFNAGYRLIASVKLALSSGASMPSESEASGSASVEGAQTETKTSPTPSPKGKTSTPTPTGQAESLIGTVERPYVLIKDTPTGFLRVRTEASTGSAELARVKPGDKYGYLDTKDTWYKIKLDASRSGWVSNQYADKVE